MGAIIGSLLGPNVGLAVGIDTGALEGEESGIDALRIVGDGTGTNGGADVGSLLGPNAELAVGIDTGAPEGWIAGGDIGASCDKHILGVKTKIFEIVIAESNFMFAFGVTEPVLVVYQGEQSFSV